MLLFYRIELGKKTFSVITHGSRRTRKQYRTYTQSTTAFSHLEVHFTFSPFFTHFSQTNSFLLLPTSCYRYFPSLNSTPHPLQRNGKASKGLRRSKICVCLPGSLSSWLLPGNVERPQLYLGMAARDPPFCLWTEERNIMLEFPLLFVTPFSGLALVD